MRPRTPLGAALWLFAGGCSQAPEGLGGLSPVELDVAPVLDGSLDFGTVLAGETASRQVTLRNEGDSQVGFRLMAPNPRMEDGLELRAVTPSGVLDPWVSVELDFRLEVPAEAQERSRSGTLPVLVESLSGTPLQTLEIGWSYRISRSGLAIEPNPLVLGPVAFGATIEGTLTVRNASPRAQDVYSLDRAGGEARFSLAAGDFQGLPPVDEQGVWTRLQPREATELAFSYTAPPEGAGSKEEAIWRIGFCDDPSCQELARLEGIGANIGPDLFVSPEDSLTFPRVPLGRSAPVTFVLSNRGSEPVRITSVEIEEAPEAFVFEGDYPLVLGPGESERRDLRFEPQEERSYSALLNIESDDPEKPLIQVLLKGIGVDLPPCQYSVDPQAIDFPRLPSLEEEIERVTVRNIGMNSCLLFDVRLEEAEGVPAGTYTLPDAPIPSVVLPPSGTTIIRVSFRPRDMGDFEATLRMQINSEERPNIVIPIEGTGGEGLGIQCSSDLALPVGENARLGVFENATAEVVARRWRIVSAPPGGENADDIFDPDPPATAVILFKPKIVGTYVLEAQVDDAEGRSRSCEVEVEVRPREFQITLTWDGSGDLDLHVLRDNGSTWFDGTDDCFFQNKNPAWASPGLDNDEAVADGPENIRIDQPVVGQSYRVAVHNFENGAGRQARVQVYCGNQSTPDLDRRSRPLAGAASGTCTSNSDFWRLADITFTGPGQCDIDLVDDYITGRQACTPGF
jgi:hypothetical protein